MIAGGRFQVQKMNSFPSDRFPAMTAQGRPASYGKGPESYSIRIPFFIEPIGRFPELDGIDLLNRRALPIGTLQAVIERYPTFYVLHMPGFQDRSSAESYLERAGVGLLRLAVDREMAIEFSPTPEALDTSKANLRFRESFAEQNMPSWRRSDGTFTDGAIFPHWTAIVPEHLRVWEIPLGYAGHEIKQLTMNQLSEALTKAEAIQNPQALLRDEKLLLAIGTFSAAHNTWDRKAQFRILNDSFGDSETGRATTALLSRSNREPASAARNT
jgi:hypothetical protein